MGRDEIAAGSAAGVIGADAAVDVAGIEGNVGVLGGARLAGPDGGDIEGERGGVGALWAKAEEAARMQTGSLNPNEGMLYLCSILLNGFVNVIIRALSIGRM
jgi:hypothetical protein